MRFSHQGNAREDGSKAKTGSAPNPRAHPSMVREEEEAEEEGSTSCSGPRTTAPQPGSNRGEQRAHFPFGDVTGEHGGRSGHASDLGHRINNNQ